MTKGVLSEEKHPEEIGYLTPFSIISLPNHDKRPNTPCPMRMLERK